MSCPIITSPQYRELADVVNSTELAHLLWDRNGGYQLDLNPDGKPSSLFKQLLEITGNDRFEAMRLKAQFYLNEYTERNGEWYKDFVEEPSIPEYTHRDTNVKALTLVLNKLSERLGYQWRFNFNLPDQTGGRINIEGTEPVIEVNPYYGDMTTPIHEFGHMFIAAIQRDNPELYSNLIKEIRTYRLYDNMMSAIRESYEEVGLSEDELELEAIMYVIGEYGRDMIDKDSGLFKAISEVWEYIKSIILDAFGIAKTADLKLNTQLAEIAYILANPDIKVDLGKKFTSLDYLEFYSTTPLQQRKITKPLTKDEIVNKFIEHSKDIIPETDNKLAKEKGHWKFKKDDSYEYLQGVTRLMAKFGYGYLGDTETIHTKVGSVIHGHIDNISKNIISELEGDVGLSSDAIKELKFIFSKIKGKHTALTEVVIADVDTGVVGVIDLILINEEGRVMLFDFKTKIRKLYTDETGEQKLAASTFAYWDRVYDKGYTDKDKAHLQLSIYAHMIEKVLGVHVGSISVVKLDATVQGNVKNKKFEASKNKEGKSTILDIEVNMPDEESLSESFYGKKGNIEFHNATERVYYGDSAHLHSATMENVFRSERDEAVFGGLKRGDTEASRILAKLKDEIALRIKVARKRADYSRRKELESLVTRLQEETDVTDSIYEIIASSHEEMMKLEEEINGYFDSKKPFNPGILYKWKDAVQGYKGLEELKNSIMDDPKIIPNREYVKLLNEVIDRVHYFEGLYIKEGRYLIAKWLTPFYNGIKAKYQDSIASDYRRLKYQEVKKRKRSLDDFEKEYGDLDAFMAKKINSGKIEKETFDLIYKELEVASQDVNDLMRWVDNMLDSSDVVASALVNAFVRMDELARQDAIDKKYEIIDAFEELNLVHGKKAFQSEESYYSFMLEHDEKGNPTQSILRPYKSAFWEDVNALREKYKTTHTKQEISSVTKEFIDKHRLFNKEEFEDELINFLDELYHSKQMTAEEFKIIREYISVNPTLYVDDLTRTEGLNQELVDKIQYWKGKNIALFYSYSDRYINPEWSKFMKQIGVDTSLSMYRQIQELRKSTNPYAKFYNFIEDLNKQANQMIPAGYRIYDRLPGVSKMKSERIKAGQSALEIAKETMSKDLFVKPDDLERGSQEYTTEYGRIKYYIPIHFTSKVEPQNQSYDLAGIYFKFWESSNDYMHKRKILPELEMSRFFINQRKVQKRNMFKHIVKTSTGLDDQNDSPILQEGSVLADMFNDWFEMALYGKYSRSTKTLIQFKEGGRVFDVSKFTDVINRYTALNLLGGNVVQGFANVLIGETMQAIESIAHEYVNPKSYSKASLAYLSFLPKFLGDATKHAPTSLGGLIYQEFNVLDDDAGDVMFSKATAIGRALSSTSVYIMQRSGEHWMQNRFLLAMLIEKKAYDSNGKLLGNMLDQYEVTDGRLALKKEVDLAKSKWTIDDQMTFKRKVRGILSRMHGEYSDLGRVALQRMAIGRMAYMFRKFVIPGFKRRWGYKRYVERLGKHVEGNYVTTFKFFKDYFKDIATLKFAVMGENWAALSDHEKANIRRTLSEAAFIIATIIMASVFFNMKGVDDDEDRDWEYSFLAYQAYRLRAEMLFWSPKFDEAFSILRSPMASMAVFENILRLSSQLFDPGETYQRGPFKGQLKVKKIMLDFVPLYKQYYKARDIEQQISWFRN